MEFVESQVIAAARPAVSRTSGEPACVRLCVGEGQGWSRLVRYRRLRLADDRREGARLRADVDWYA